jgi:16S rRNA (guanine527-N7)-methyltransferase
MWDRRESFGNKHLSIQLKYCFFTVDVFFKDRISDRFIMQKQQLMIRSLCSEYHIPVTDDGLNKLVRYASLLEEWNRKINLISRKEDAPVIVKHVFHSLLISIVHTFRAGEKVLDLGTGGGLPGIPLAIVFPETSFLLVDATGKKIKACQDMIRELDLGNVMALHARAEEIRGLAFDTILSRQVAPLAELCGYASKLLKSGGMLICLKGGMLDREISDALAAKEKNNGFPSTVELHPISNISTFFTDKQIVIARW